MRIPTAGEVLPHAGQIVIRLKTTSSQGTGSFHDLYHLAHFFHVLLPTAPEAEHAD